MFRVAQSSFEQRQHLAALLVFNALQTAIDGSLRAIDYKEAEVGKIGLLTLVGRHKP